MRSPVLPVLALLLSSFAVAQPAPPLQVLNSVKGAYAPSFTADGRTVYFTGERAPHGRMPAHGVIMTSRLAVGEWTAPAWMEFSGQNQEGSAVLSPDGSRLYFWSYRAEPELGPVEKRGNCDIWFVEREGAGWSLPRNLGAPVNSPDREYVGSFAADGTMYLTSTRGGKGNADLYAARREGSGFAEPVSLGEAINTQHGEWDAAISPDGQTLVFASDRPGVLGRWDLFVSFRKDGAWQPAKHLGPRFNSVFRESGARFSPDGKRLFFNSDRNGRSQIYEVEAAALLESAEPHPYASAQPMPEPVPFAKGTGGVCITFAPDGKTAFLAQPKPRPSRIMTMRFEDGRWSTPEVAGFSGSYQENDPVFSPDGRRLFFSSQRPVTGQDPGSSQVWYIEKTAEGWSEPKRPGGPAMWNGSFASTTADGTLYFFSGGPDSLGGADMYRVPYLDGRYGQRENLGEIVNGRGTEVDPYVAPDGSYLIFASDRPGGMGKHDLYVTLNNQDHWGPPRSLGPVVNSSSFEFCPAVSPDGRYFFFTSDRSGQPEIYQVDIGALRLGE